MEIKVNGKESYKSNISTCKKRLKSILGDN